MSRKIIPFTVAIVLSCLVMIVVGVFAFSGAVTAEKFGSNIIWNQPYNTAESMKSGIILGSAAMLDGMIDRFTKELGEVKTIVATGGASGTSSGKLP